jgi:molecular chaperone GrpE
MSEDKEAAGAVDTDEAQARLAELEAENAALKDQVMRYAAEVDNTKRRAEREANDARAFGIQKFAKDLLAAADNLGRALGAAPADEADQVVSAFVTGVEMTHKALHDAFERNGLKKVDPQPGEKFDPHLHQAVMEVPAPVAAGTVASTLQPGYELFGRTVRAAMVAVAAKGSGQDMGAAPAGANPYAKPEEHEGEAVDTKA